MGSKVFHLYFIKTWKAGILWAEYFEYPSATMIPPALTTNSKEDSCSRISFPLIVQKKYRYPTVTPCVKITLGFDRLLEDYVWNSLVRAECDTDVTSGGQTLSNELLCSPKILRIHYIIMNLVC